MWRQEVGKGKGEAQVKLEPHFNLNLGFLVFFRSNSGTHNKKNCLLNNLHQCPQFFFQVNILNQLQKTKLSFKSSNLRTKCKFQMKTMHSGWNILLFPFLYPLKSTLAEIFYFIFHFYTHWVFFLFFHFYTHWVFF